MGRLCLERLGILPAFSIGFVISSASGLIIHRLLLLCAASVSRKPSGIVFFT